MTIARPRSVWYCSTGLLCLIFIMTSLPLYTVDAFTKTPFGGNQAAVCLVGERNLSESTMQSLASEMNISETAYLEFCGSGTSFKNGDRFGLRWFTPTNEVALCGHATLASAAVLFFECGNVNTEITFSTLSGDLKVSLHEGQITMDFPLNDPAEVNLEDWQGVIEAVLGCAASDVEDVFLSTTAKKLVVLLLNKKHSLNRLASISPDFDKMMASHDGSIAKGVIVTTEGVEGYDFLSRYFGPWNGIPEDPVTGSAHTVLGPLWSRILEKKEMKARQCSKRGGDVGVTVSDDRVYIRGSAVVIVRGTVTLTL